MCCCRRQLKFLRSGALRKRHIVLFTVFDGGSRPSCPPVATRKWDHWGEVSLAVSSERFLRLPLRLTPCQRLPWIQHVNVIFAFSPYLHGFCVELAEKEAHGKHRHRQIWVLNNKNPNLSDLFWILICLFFHESWCHQAPEPVEKVPEFQASSAAMSTAGSCVTGGSLSVCWRDWNKEVKTHMEVAQTVSRTTRY